MNFLAIAFPKNESEAFQKFMSQEWPKVKLTVFDHSHKTGWDNINLAVESAFDLYAIGYDFRGYQTAEIFSNLDLGETKPDQG